MKVLIVFATTEGHTRKVARYAMQSMQGDGHIVELVDCSQIGLQIDVASYDAVMLAASVHNKRYQQAMYDFVAANREVLQSKPLAFVSVSLAITLAGGEEEARSYVDGFVSEAGVSLDHVHLAEGAIRYGDYSRSEASTINLVVFKGQKQMPPRGTNPEYTDWDAITQFCKSFLEAVEATTDAPQRNEISQD